MGLLSRLFGLEKRAHTDDNDQDATGFETGEYDQAITS